MANRIITATVTGETIRLSERNAGAVGSFNAVSLAFTFDGAWDGTTKKVIFLNAYGENAAYTLLTTDLLVEGAYVVPIPAEPLEFAGEMSVTIRGIEMYGETTERIIMSTSTTMKVSSALTPPVSPIEPNATQAEQLQSEIDDIKSTITNAAASAAAAANSATAADTSASEAESSANQASLALFDTATLKSQAQTSATNAANSATAAANSASTATTKAGEASISATNASNSATAATNTANQIVTDENSRVTAENGRVSAESIRASNEATRTNAESTRVTNENARIANEGDASSGRVKAEADRVTAESLRATAETNRGNAETTRGSNETTRQSNETTRQNNESARVSAEETRAAFYDGFSSSISELNTDLSNSTVIGSEIYGAYWDKDATPTLTRLNLAKNAIVNLGIDATYAVNEFDTSSLFSNFEKVTDSYGNVFVRIPRIYIKKVDTTGHKAWYASRRPFAGAYLPKCFWDFTNNKELDYVDVGAYTASSADDTKLDSKSGTYPLINKTIVQMRKMAQANGAGYQQLDIHIVDLLQTLFVIEQATIQSQSKVAGYTAGQYTATHTATVAETAVNRIIVATATAALFEVGQAISIGTSQGGNQIFYGRTITAKTVINASNTAIEFDGTAVNIAVGNMLYNTGAKSGFSSNVAASVGSVTSNTIGKTPFVWHGIENLFGSVYQFVDGININERQAWVCPDAASYASNLFTAPYEQLSYINSVTDGYIKEMGYDPARPYASFPAAVGGSSTTYYGDYYYQSTGQRIALLGGRWGDGTVAGLFDWALSHSSSISNVTFGGRLVRKAL